METLPKWPAWLATFSVSRLAEIFFIVANIALISGWLMSTPSGLLGKADAAGYAVCHRIEARSFKIGDRQTPLCARCSGMYLGALLGMIYLSRFGRPAALPSAKISVVLGLFVLAFAIDGANSYLHLFPFFPGIYEPNNVLRLLTGTGIGIGIAAVLTPVFHQVAWKDALPEPSIGTWRRFLPLLGLAGLVDLAVLSDNPLLLYPLALLSAVSIVIILLTVYLIIWVMITKQENRFEKISDLRIPILAGLFTAFLQITALDVVRYWLTGTWNGFMF